MRLLILPLLLLSSSLFSQDCKKVILTSDYHSFSHEIIDFNKCAYSSTLGASKRETIMSILNKKFTDKNFIVYFKFNNDSVSTKLTIQGDPNVRLVSHTKKVLDGVYISYDNTYSDGYILYDFNQKIATLTPFGYLFKLTESPCEF